MDKLYARTESGDEGGSIVRNGKKIQVKEGGCILQFGSVCMSIQLSPLYYISLVTKWKRILTWQVLMGGK